MSSKMQMVFPYPGKRRPQNVEKVTFKRSGELKLKDMVRERALYKYTPCLFEMSMVFTCLKESNFNDSLCVEELQKFNGCYNNYIAEQKEMKQRKNNISKKANAKSLLTAEVNELLWKFSSK